MFCSRCGKPLQPGSSFCVTCNGPAVATSAPAPWAGRAPAAAVQATAAPTYAGFWLRLLAYVIDSVAVSFGTGILNAMFGFAAAMSGMKADAMAVVPLGTMIAVPWLYFALFESSPLQASLGKMALGLRVTDADGRRIGFGRATGRFFAKIVSALPLLVGFLLAGFTERKRALHDMIAGTLVTRKGTSSVGVIVAVVAAVLFGGVMIVGVLAAIAIPNFIRYQLRAKSAEVTTLLPELARSEIAVRQRTGRLVPVELPASGVPGAQKLPWSAEDLARAQELGWSVSGATYFTYRVAVDGEAFSACAESDIDGDGKFAAFALWHPDAAGNAPTAPCVHVEAPQRPLEFAAGDQPGTAVRLSGENVF